MGQVCGAMRMAFGVFLRWQRQASRQRTVAAALALCGACLVSVVDGAKAQSPPEPASGPAKTEKVVAVSGNPAATTFTTGTGWLGRQLGLRDEWGVTLGGVWLADTNLVAAGGVQKGGWTNNSALFVGLGIDADKLVGWQGASFGFQFLQLNAGNTNGEAGSVQGYNGIVGPPPFNRTELFEAWYAQEMIKDVLKMRIGRVNPAADFNNVLRPVTFTDSNQNIPAVSGLIYSTVFANGTLIGSLPGYYNSGNGVTVNFTPTKSFYVNLGVYDGNNALRVQTGMAPPTFNGYYFNIGEIGTNWTLGEANHPGQFGIGLWRQTGILTAPGVTQDGAGGVYMFASQRIAHGVNERVPSSGVSTFVQFGASNALTPPINQYYGAGLTGFGLIGDRAQDSMGFGAALSRLNPVLYFQPYELMFQAYYQAHLYAATFLQPTVSFIPAPGAAPNLPPTLTTTMRLTVLF
jgi:porin